MEWTPASGEQERHNVTVITVGSRYCSLYSISSSLSHATLEQPFRTPTNKVRGKILLKKSSFLCLPSCVVYSCVIIMLVSGYHCVGMHPAYIYIYIYIYICMYISAWTANVNITQVPFFESLVWLELELNPSLPDHWRTLYSLDVYKWKDEGITESEIKVKTGKTNLQTKRQTPPHTQTPSQLPPPQLPPSLLLLLLLLIIIHKRTYITICALIFG